MKYLKFLTFFVFIFFFSSFPKPIYAQSSGCDGANYGMTQAIAASIINATTGGIEGINCAVDAQLGDEMEQAVLVGGGSDVNNPEQSMLHTLNNGVAYMIRNRPAGTDIYVADLIHSINPARPSYAQGLGFASLTPILGIWKAIRNVSYFAFTIIFVVVGFAIMFRAKLSAQTVVSIESALPRLILSLLLITFSYAIVGLLIDVMYLLIYLLIGVFNLYIFPGRFDALETIALGRNVFGNVFSGFLDYGSEGALGSTARAIADIAESVLSEIFTEGIITNILATGTGILAWLVLSIVLLVTTFKIFFSLLTTYIQIIFLTIFSPLIILKNALPGDNSFINWLKNIAGNLMVFPTPIALIFLAYALSGGGSSGDTQLTPDETIGYRAGEAPAGFVPPQLGFQGRGNAIQGIIAVGVVLAMPSILDQVKKALGAAGGGGGGGDSFMGGLLGGGLGAALAPGLNPLKRIGGMAMGSWKGNALSTIVEGAAANGWGGAMGAIPGALNPVGMWSRGIGGYLDSIKLRKAQQKYYEDRTKDMTQGRGTGDVVDKQNPTVSQQYSNSDQSGRPNLPSGDPPSRI